MPIVDTAYVRSEYRNRGFGTEILSDVIARFPNEDIGFSKPISNGMLRSKYSTRVSYQIYNNTHISFVRSPENISDESQRISIAFLGNCWLRYRRVSTTDMVSFKKNGNDIVFMTKTIRIYYKNHRNDVTG